MDRFVSFERLLLYAPLFNVFSSCCIVVVGTLGDVKDEDSLNATGVDSTGKDSTGEIDLRIGFLYSGIVGGCKSGKIFFEFNSF